MPYDDDPNVDGPGDPVPWGAPWGPDEPTLDEVALPWLGPTNPDAGPAQVPDPTPEL